MSEFGLESNWIELNRFPASKVTVNTSCFVYSYLSSWLRLRFSTFLVSIYLEDEYKLN